MTIEELQDWLAHNPRSPLFARLADSYLRLERTDEALKLCVDGLQHFPHYATARVVAARCLAQKGDFAAAISHLEAARSIYPENSELGALHDVWVKQGTPNHPGGVRTQSIKSTQAGPDRSTAEITHEHGSPDDVPIVSATLAEIYTTQGAYEAAIAMYRKLQRQKPQQRMQYEAKIRELMEKLRQKE